MAADEKTIDAETFQKNLNYRFKKKELLLLGLTHRSFSNENHLSDTSNNERLEFLGDSVLDLVISQLLLDKYPTKPEGFLSKQLASLINERSLANIARGIDLGDALRLGKGENRTGGRKKNSILADAYEAVIAAVYLDGGLKVVSKIISDHFVKLIDAKLPLSDFKTQLQETVQRTHHQVPRYRVIKQSGKDHSKIFEVEVSLNRKKLGSGSGKSKKEAEQNAAKQALQAIKKTKAKKAAKKVSKKQKA